MTTNRVPFEGDEPPEPPRSPEPTGAGRRPSWQRQPMVRWFDPVQLAGTGVRALLSSIFGSYADKREVQAALSRDIGKPTIHDFSDQDHLWIDFTADLGDGFDSTYTVARLLGQESLTLAGPAPSVNATEAAGVATNRGRVLVLGGDQVYPTATREEYTNRFVGPYEAALPPLDKQDRPRLFAVPGNHDWYDGLTSFMRLYCQQRSIGEWQTAQTRSYFALKLPHRWWLLGIDIQLSADIDQPQLDYFTRVAEQMQPGDQVILCTGQPAWIDADERPAAYDNLAYFERVVLCPRKARLMVTLTGDLHHYARYSDSTGDRQKITAGGGGAYLYGTHLLPERIELPVAAPGESGEGATEGSRTFERKAVYPEPAASRRLRWGALLLGLKNPGFVLFLGILYTLNAWLLQDASRTHLTSRDLLAWLSSEPLSRIGIVVETVLRMTLRAPILLAVAALLVFALYQFCTSDPGRPKWYRWFGAVHGVVHLTLVLLLSWLFAWVNLAVLGIRTPEVQALVFLGEMVLIGGPIGAFVFGLALLPGVNFNEAYSAQHLESYKNFLRLHLTESGALTIYPVGIDRVTRWEPDPNAGSHDLPFRAKDGVGPVARLIEEPITVPAPLAPRILAHAIVKEGA